MIETHCLKNVVFFQQQQQKKKKYATKIVNVYIVCDLDAWPRNPNNNFKLKNSLFGAISIVKD